MIWLRLGIPIGKTTLSTACRLLKSVDSIKESPRYHLFFFKKKIQYLLDTCRYTSKINHHLFITNDIASILTELESWSKSLRRDTDVARLRLELAEAETSEKQTFTKCHRYF